MTPRPRSVVYHRPRERRRAPAVAVGTVGLSVLVLTQLAVASSLPVVRDGTGPAPVAAGPTTPVTADGAIVPTAGTGAAPTAAAGDPPVPAVEPSVDVDDLTPVPLTTVAFAVGAVVDQQALAGLDPVLSVLTVPDAAPVLLTGSAEPGPDAASALRLAQQRADAVATVLVEAGAPASLLRTAAVVDPGAGRSVVVAPDAP